MFILRVNALKDKTNNYGTFSYNSV